jgi:ribosomal protein S12 methylthiotransferase accessory factor
MNRPWPLPRPGTSAPTPKRFLNATHRTQDPADTVERLLPLLPRFGITRVANVTGLDHIGIPVVMVCRPNSRSVAVSQGKGLTLNAAKASGIMESIELWHAERIDAPLRLASQVELAARRRTVDVSLLPRRRQGRYTPDLPMLWIEAHDLGADETTWLPYELVTMASTLPPPTGSGCFIGTSNGLSSGNHLLEALSHGICEVVERDATSLWRARGTFPSPERVVDLSTVDDPWCREAIERCAAAGVHTLAWDITSDIALPVFACFITEPHALRPIRCSAIGYGCHPDRGVALFRALSEAIQSRLTYIAGSRDDIFRREYEDNLRTRESIAQLQALAAVRPARRFTDAPTYANDTLDADVELELSVLRAAGVRQVLAIDLTEPSVGIPVVRVVVPGLEAADSDPDYVMGGRALAASRAGAP